MIKKDNNLRMIFNRRFVIYYNRFMGVSVSVFMIIIVIYCLNLHSLNKEL